MSNDNILREKTINILKDIKNIKLKNNEIKDLEIGLFNWSLDFADKNQIIKNWENTHFVKVYINKCVSIISNLNENTYIKNDSLYKKLNNKEILPHNIPYLKPQKVPAG